MTWTPAPLQPALCSVSREAVEAWVARFAESRYRGKSLRCARCAETRTCQGQLVQRLRAFGFRVLEPRA